MKQMEALMSNPDGIALLQEMQSNPAVMEAAMDIASNGETAAAKYAGNVEVMKYMQRLEKLMLGQ